MRNVILAVALSGFFAGSVMADSVEHFKGVPSDTLEQAVANFSEYNQKLAEVLAGELDNNAMVEVHELTYTIENALAKINAEFTELADTLEEVHLASEKFDAAEVQAKGDTYVSVATQVIP